MIEAFPLQWPAGFERTWLGDRKYGKFQCTVAQARDGVLAEISRLKGVNPIISSNVPVKKDGQMYANVKAVDGDNGVAVYFTWDNEQYVLACDQYMSLQDNLRAIEKSIDALRGLKRWGASDILKRAFNGFKALPESSERPWFEVLGVEENAYNSEIISAYKWLAKKYHPDNLSSGDNERFLEVKAAFDKIKEQRKF